MVVFKGVAVIFANIYWLFLGAAVSAGLVLAAIYSAKKARFELERFISSKMLVSMGAAPRGLLKTAAVSFFIGAAALSFAALARPQWGYTLKEALKTGVDVFILLDCSKSMLAQDIKPNRIERAKLEVLDFLKAVEGDRIGLVVFSGTAFCACPLTSDIGAFSMILKDVSTSSLPRAGTDIGLALNRALDSFDQASAARKVIVLVTDGEDHGPGAKEAAERAKKMGVIIHVVGLGSEQGAPIPEPQNGEGELYVKDRSGTVVMSKLQPEPLREIARHTSGTFVYNVSGSFNLRELYRSSILPMDKTVYRSIKQRVYTERFQWFLGFAILLFAAQIFMIGLDSAGGSCCRKVLK